MTVRLNLDPTLARVIVMAILLTIKDIIMGLLYYTQQGILPEPAELYTIVLSACLTLVIFILTFLQTGEIPPQE